MSEFSVHRTADTIPALKYCLILDGERIAGGKPDYRGNNHLISWSTRETYGPVDQLKAENAKLRNDAELLRGMLQAKRQEAHALMSENAQLRELVRDYHRFADAMCAEHDCNGCSQRDDGACERGVLTSRECVLGVAE